MRSNTINYLAVGAFVLVMIAGFVVAVAMLTGRTGATDDYYAIYDNVTGVKFGTQVLYEGYPIGQVEEVTPVEEQGRMRFKVDLEIKQGWRIPEDSLAQIAAPGLLSAVTVSVAAGRSQTPLAAGSRIREREQSSIFSVMSSVASDLGDLTQQDIRPLLQSLTRLVEGDGQNLIRQLTGLVTEMAVQFPTITRNIDEFTDKMNKTSDEITILFRPENRAQIEQAIANMNTAATDFARLTRDLTTTRKTLDGLLANANEAVSESRPDVEKALTDARFVADSIARRIESINQNLEGASRNMYEFSRQIRQNPGLLLGSTPPRDQAGSGR
jgi:phospholipid/cholesterol/gamma-HCH transport system substrate-binding protein